MWPRLRTDPSRGSPDRQQLRAHWSFLGKKQEGNPASDHSRMAPGHPTSRDGRLTRGGGSGPHSAPQDPQAPATRPRVTPEVGSPQDFSKQTEQNRCGRLSFAKPGATPTSQRTSNLGVAAQLKSDLESREGPPPHPASRPRGRRRYLQGGDALARGLRVLAQKPLLVQELPVAPVAGRLEQPVVQDVLQALVQGAQNPLLCDPHGRVRVKPKALLQRRTKTPDQWHIPPGTWPEMSEGFPQTSSEQRTPAPTLQDEKSDPLVARMETRCQHRRRKARTEPLASAALTQTLGTGRGFLVNHAGRLGRLPPAWGFSNPQRLWTPCRPPGHPAERLRQHVHWSQA